MPAISPSEFDTIRELLHERAAIVLEDGKEYLAEARLEPLAAEEGFESIGALVAELRLQRSEALRTSVVEAMITHETLFFRDIHPFQALKDHVIPGLLLRNSATRTLRIWSAGCSSGQEPYSIAMLIKEYFPQLLTWKVQILATDVSAPILDRAREGRYSLMEMNRGLPATFLVKYFDRDGTDWRIKRDIRSMVEFREMNLAAGWPVCNTMDIVFLRNVMIYFDTESKKNILSKMQGVLDPRGYLFLGSCESMLNLSDIYRQVQLDQAWCYQLPSQGA